MKKITRTAALPTDEKGYEALLETVKAHVVNQIFREVAEYVTLNVQTIDEVTSVTGHIYVSKGLWEEIKEEMK